MDQICTCQQSNLDGLASTIAGFNALSYSVDLMIKMVQHYGCRLVLLLHRFPRINHQPVGGLIHGELAHSDTIRIIAVSAWTKADRAEWTVGRMAGRDTSVLPMFSASQTGLTIGVRHGG